MVEHFQLEGGESCGALLAEDGLPWIENPLQAQEGQAYILEIPLKPRDVRKLLEEDDPLEMSYIASAGKRARVEVSLKTLTSDERQMFDLAKQKELTCWLQTNAVRKILRHRLNPEQILRSRWVLTWKSPEDANGSPKAKARLVVLGYEDPQLTSVARDSPTLTREGRSVILQTIASHKWRLQSFDIKTAFLRGKADPKNRLAMDPPIELRKLMNLQDTEVCELLGNAYGRVDAPLLFYKELKSQMIRLGFEVHPLDPCIFILRSGQGDSQVLHGIAGMHVDDGLCGGDPKFQNRIQQLQQTLPFGSQKQSKFTFTGIGLDQLPDMSIRACQKGYVEAILPIHVVRDRRQSPESPVNASELTSLRGLIGSLQYAVTHTRPDLAAKLGEIQSQMSGPTVQTMLDANKVLREAKEFQSVTVTFQSIPVCDLTFVSFGDASFASSRNLNSHQGVLVGATTCDLQNNQEAPFTPLVWISKRISRVVRSTLSADAYAMSKSVDTLGWIRAMWGCINLPDFEWSRPREAFHKMHPALIITDCKSLYDLVTRTALPSCEEYRTTLEVLLIRQRCEEHTVFRWIPTSLMLADALTKAMSSDLLRTVFLLGRFKLHDAQYALDKAAPQTGPLVAWQFLVWERSRWRKIEECEFRPAACATDRVPS